jgi:DNA helicase HerA-like ATPase
LQFVGENAKEFTLSYGNISLQSIGAIQRNLLALSQNGGDILFGEPEFDLRDWLAYDEKGRGMINILDCVALFRNPLLYSTFLLWMLSDIYEMMPEVGDLKLPKMVFFFDEAHLLFNDAPKALLQKIEQVIRLIRSKGVGVFFISQSPADIPDTVLSQLGNRIQHALHTYTPKDQRTVKAAAAALRANPAFNSEKVIGELAAGEALISALDENGAPQMVQRGFILPPKSFMGAAEPELINSLTLNSPLFSKYAQMIDRESAFEVLQKKQQQPAKKAAPQQEAQKEQTKTAKRGEGMLDRVLKSALSQIGRDAGRALMRGLMDTMKKK